MRYARVIVPAFFGRITLGRWTPYVLAVFAEAFLATVGRLSSP
nr:hypothetical protein [Haloplanus sp. GDY1]